MTLIIPKIQIENGWIEQTTYEAALAAGVAVEAAGAALKGAAIIAVEAEAETYRQKVSEATAGKLDAWRIKAEIASDPSSASANELALIDREALARGTDRAGLLETIATRATAWREVALLIEVIEAEAKGFIAAIDDDLADIEERVAAALAAAREQAEVAFASVNEV